MAFKSAKEVPGFSRPQEKFTGVLEEWEVSSGEKWKALDLIFNVNGDKKNLRLFGIDKIKDAEDGGLDIPDNTQIGIFDASLKKFGIDQQFDLEGDQVRYEPGIKGKTVTMNPTKIKTDAEGRKNAENWVVDGIEGMTPSQSQKPSTTQPGQSSVNMKGRWEEFLAEHLTTPTNKAGIIKLVTKINPSDREALNKSRDATLAELVKSGFLELNEKAQYSVKG